MTQSEIKPLSFLIERYVCNVLRYCEGNKKLTAQKLGISRSTLYRMMEQWEVK